MARVYLAGESLSEFLWLQGGADVTLSTAQVRSGANSIRVVTQATPSTFGLINTLNAARLRYKVAMWLPPTQGS
jgi:hypothetical protein